MDLRQLGYLVAISEEGSFTRAAARCNIVQSGLSSQIAKLERELGMRLFERTSRTVRLAPAGEVLVPYARLVLRELDRARAEVAALAGGVRGVLRLGVIPIDHGAIDLPGILAAYHRRYPDVDVVVSDTGSLEMVSMLQAGALDAAFLGLFPQQLPAALTHRLLKVEPLVAIMDADHVCARRGRVDLRELATGSGFIDCHVDSGLRTQVDLAFSRAGAERHVSFELGNLRDVAQLASLGLGVAIVPAGIAASLPPGTQFAVRPLADAEAVQPVSLVCRPVEVRSPPARAFVDLFHSAPLVELLAGTAAPSPVIGHDPSLDA